MITDVRHHGKSKDVGLQQYLMMKSQ